MKEISTAWPCFISKIIEMIHQGDSPEGRKLVRPATYWSHAGPKIATILSLTLRHQGDQATHDDPDVMKQHNGQASV